ncbi:hypothetical protein HNR75_002386 [Tolumonas osonensis]|uniref:Uncharacterized protein n=1 Tax=Tolumonas osonensis TaxID=675874 RepID=A0A841GBF4_9GAMM|nr:hypothetical protein [Tolumonas osonensis]
MTQLFSLNHQHVWMFTLGLIKQMGGCFFIFSIKGEIQSSGGERGAIVQISSHSAAESVIIPLFSEIRGLFIPYPV